MEILSIGNSFSQDAQRYLHEIARACGENVRTVNLYIGGCPLDSHHKNMVEDNRAYEIQCNGHNTGFYTSIREALTSRKWDVVTLQQASAKSPYIDTYSPYIGELAEYVRSLLPDAKLFIHQTWSYKEGSDLLANLKFPTSALMQKEVTAAYAKACELIQADGLIPSGEVLGMLRTCHEVHRDSAHASLGLGRYALALTWYSVLLGKRFEKAPEIYTDEPITDEERLDAVNAVNDVLSRY